MDTSTEISSITTKWINYNVFCVQYLFLHLKELYNYANNMCITVRVMANAVPHILLHRLFHIFHIFHFTKNPWALNLSYYTFVFYVHYCIRKSPLPQWELRFR